jgi:hypothetical protein
MGPLGFSTGAFHNFLNPVSRETIDICLSFKLDAIEISCMRAEDIEQLRGLYEEGLSPYFSHISLHAPTRKIKYGDNSVCLSVLEKIWEAHLHLDFNAVIIHPDLVEDFSVFKDCPLPIAFENMDCRKIFGRNPEDFEFIFNLIDSKLVLDLNHCYTNDISLELARKFKQDFNDRICEYHLSGYKQYHELLHVTRQSQLIGAIPEKGTVPIIIESCCFNLTQATKELRYIQKHLKP